MSMDEDIDGGNDEEEETGSSDSTQNLEELQEQLRQTFLLIQL